jgi:mono/diheme cytochrome c family protein
MGRRLLGIAVALVAACEMAQSPVRRGRAPGAAQEARAPDQLWLGYCASCHGARGEGTPVAMVRLDAAWQAQRSDSLIQARIMYGVPGTTMAPWGRELSSEELARLVTYVRQIGR